jgi:hypothetical protein
MLGVNGTAWDGKGSLSFQDEFILVCLLTLEEDSTHVCKKTFFSAYFTGRFHINTAILKKRRFYMNSRKAKKTEDTHGQVQQKDAPPT